MTLVSSDGIPAAGARPDSSTPALSRAVIGDERSVGGPPTTRRGASSACGVAAGTGAREAAPDGAASDASDSATPVATGLRGPGAAARSVDRAADTLLTAAVAASAVGRMLREDITLPTGASARAATACVTDADDIGDGRAGMAAGVPRTTRNGAAGSGSAAETTPPFGPARAAVAAGAAEERSSVASPAGALPLVTVVGAPDDGAGREATGAWDDGPVGAGRAAGGDDTGVGIGATGAGTGAADCTDAGAGGDAGAGVAGRGGRTSSGSRYASVCSPTRTPRWTDATACSGSPLQPIVPIGSPSMTASPFATPIDPRWTSVTA